VRDREPPLSDELSRALRVLVLTQHFWPETLRINDIAASLTEQGCEVTVLTGKPNYPTGRVFDGHRLLGVQQDSFGGCHIVRLPLVPRGRGRAWELSANYLSFILSVCVLGPWALRGRRFDVVFVYGTSPILQAVGAIWLKTLRRIPVITWVQDLWPESLMMTGFVRNRHLLRGVESMVRWIYRRSDLLLVQSPAFLEPVREKAGDVAVIYQPNPGESSRWTEAAPAGASAPPWVRQPGFNIVFAGNLGTVQALETVLEAARLTGPDSGIRWVLMGSGSRLPWLRERLREPGLEHVELPGRFDPVHMPSILEQADALLVSLVSGPGLNSTIPSKIQAYLAMGKPILASIDGEGARVVGEAKAGLVCPAENAQALADSALRLRDMPTEDRLRMGASGRAYFQARFAPELVASQLVDHFRSVIPVDGSAVPRGRGVSPPDAPGP
jgi:glycosyltransferase involved in cell wall biosynthesis